MLLFEGHLTGSQDISMRSQALVPLNQAELKCTVALEKKASFFAWLSLKGNLSPKKKLNKRGGIYWAEREEYFSTHAVSHLSSCRICCVTWRWPLSLRSLAFRSLSEFRNAAACFWETTPLWCCIWEAKGEQADLGGKLMPLPAT